jgi:hypothetical protein
MWSDEMHRATVLIRGVMLVGCDAVLFVAFIDFCNEQQVKKSFSQTYAQLFGGL